MSNAIWVKIGDQLFCAELSNCPAAKQLLEALPMKLRMSNWGQEYYGDCGPTPASTDERPRAASAVAPLGKFTGAVEAFGGFGSAIEVQIAEEE